MDIDEFLDRELSDLGLQTDITEKTGQAGLPGFEEQLELSPLFENIKANLGKGNLEQAELSYVQLWRILIEQKLKWNNELYDQLSILSRQFSIALNNAYNELKRKADRIYELISRARASLKEGKNELPFKIYAEIQEINNSIPNVFFEEKKVISEQIMDFYKELNNVTDNELVKRVASIIQEIYKLIDKINSSIRSNDTVNAIVNYNKCLELYNQVPEGFLRYKNSIGMRLLEIYKSLRISTEISILQNQLSRQVPQPVSQQIPQERRPALLQRFGPTQTGAAQTSASTKTMLLNAKKERAKKNIEKGFYNEASKDIQDALQLEPTDAEAKAIHAKIKTLQ